ncbi:TraV family lipoprotein [Pseudoduganella sp. UC29_71]|uniref:TraV family lipoprotein n=1 Tax=Pseudoduganella sp. UC29_71 TaxID=3350174 RepID=UPI00366DF58B
MEHIGSSKIMARKLRALALLSPLALAGCGNLSGLDGSPKLSCKAPEGVHCASVSANYHSRSVSSVDGASRHEAALARPLATEAPQTAAPPGLDPVALRSPVRVLRLWIKAWEDSDRDLVDQSYVYVRIDDGQWQLAHAQRAAREAYAPLRPPPSRPSGQMEAAATPTAASDGAEVARAAAAAAPPAAAPLRQ